ncbi:MAG: hypothetical protein ABSD88_02320 [Candidatus Korobacteraceae bacterium]
MLRQETEWGGYMVAEINILNEWIPEQMQPGTVFILENAGETGETHDPFWAVLACPACGTLGLITHKQIAGLIPVICGSETCSAQFFISNEEIVPRRAS